MQSQAKAGYRALRDHPVNRLISDWVKKYMYHRCKDKNLQLWYYSSPDPRKQRGGATI